MLKTITTVCAAVFLFSWQGVQAKTYSKKLCQSPNYECFTIKKSVTWEKLFPDEKMRDLVKRINRVNIQPYPGMVVAIPKNLNRVNYMDHAPLPQNIGPQSGKVIVVDLSKLAYGAYDPSGQLLHWGPVAGGKGYCADIQRSCRTPTGTFTIYHKRGAECKSSKYPIKNPGAPMPYCMFFKGGFALHGSNYLPGHHASYGCVRIKPEDAKWLNQHFIDTPGKNGTKVVIKPYESNSTTAS